MTAKNRGEGSDPLDRYYTPLPLVSQGYEMLLEHFGDRVQGVRRVLEPGAGRGAFCWGADLWLPYCEEFIGVDPAPPPAKERDFRYQLVRKDFRPWAPTKNPCFDLIPTNPPFTYTTAFIHKSASMLTRDGLGFFLCRIGVAAGVERYEMWTTDVNLLEVWPCVRRPGFKRDGSTDSAEYAFFTFEQPRGKKLQSQNVKMRWLDWVR